MKRLSFVAALPALAFTFVAAQLKPGDSPQAFQIPKPLAMQGHYLAALSKLEAAKPQLDKDPIEKDTYSYVHALLLANMGRQDEALAEAFGPRLPDSQFIGKTVPELDSAHAESAIKAIGREASKTRIAVLNEWHHVPQHRAFALSVARELYRRGYRYLAVEALTENDSILTNSYEVSGIGYTAEPMYGNFLRQAKRMGFKLVPYEVSLAELVKQKPEDRNTFRDSGAAKNIIARTLADPKGKVLVYCGGDHVVETPVTVGGIVHKRLANYLKDFSGVDPLTVDQMTEQYFVDEATQTPFRYAQQKGRVREETVFETAPGKFWTGGPMKGTVDMMVFHPAPKNLLGRPAWISMHGYRRPFTIDPSLRQMRGRIQVSARVKGEPDNAVPMDLVILQSGKEVPALFLPRGDYSLTVEDEAGNVLTQRNIRQR